MWHNQRAFSKAIKEGKPRPPVQCVTSSDSRTTCDRCKYTTHDACEKVSLNSFYS